MIAHATLLYASLLTFFYIYLTIRVVQERRRTRQAYGATEAYPSLLRAVRAHAHFHEYTPLFLILLLLHENTVHAQWPCHIFGLLYLIARLSHAYSLLVHEPKALEAQASLGRAFRFRFIAMILIFLTLGMLALSLLVHYLVRLAIF